MIARLALRSLRTNRWRSLLSGLGVAVGVTILICASGYLLGLRRDMARGATAPELGQVSIANREYVEHARPRHALSLDRGFLEKVRALPGVEGASARVKVFGLIGTENRSVVTRIVGVNAEHEASVTVARQGLQQGEWLSGPAAPPDGAREVVIGYKLAEQLGAVPGSELVSFFEAADGSLGNDLLRVKGILRTNVANLDGHTAFMNLNDLQYTAGLEGRAHEVAVKIDDASASGAVANAITQATGAPEILVRPWEQVRPEIAQTLELMSSLDGFMYGFVYLIVALGLFNAQRMSALERRREFAMMLAIGMGPRRLFAVVLLETLAVVALGGLGGVLIGAIITQFFAVNGFDWTALSGNENVNLQYMGVSFSRRLHFGLTAATVLGPLITLLPVALLCGLWPSLQAARTDLRTALSGRN